MAEVRALAERVDTELDQFKLWRVQHDRSVRKELETIHQNHEREVHEEAQRVWLELQQEEDCLVQKFTAVENDFVQRINSIDVKDVEARNRKLAAKLQDVDSVTQRINQSELALSKIFSSQKTLQRRERFKAWRMKLIHCSHNFPS